MDFEQALERLNIQDYKHRILGSNSHGELFHTLDYIEIAEIFEGHDASVFREWFESIVVFAEKNWSCPEHVFQHVPRMIVETNGRVVVN